MGKQETTVKKIAENYILTLVSRLGIMVICYLCVETFRDVQDIKEKLAGVVVMVQGQGDDIRDLKDWRNRMSPMAKTQ